MPNLRSKRGGVTLDGTVEWSVQQSASMASVEGVNSALNKQINKKLDAGRTGEIDCSELVTTGYVTSGTADFIFFVPITGLKKNGVVSNLQISSCAIRQGGYIFGDSSENAHFTNNIGSFETNINDAGMRIYVRNVKWTQTPTNNNLASMVAHTFKFTIS